MDKKLPEFQAYQYAFTAHIRDPENVVHPQGVSARRMKTYSELLYSNVESLLANCFPVTRQILEHAKWACLVKDFIAVHRSHTPYFRQVPDEFLQFLQNEWQAKDGFPGYLIELAHYEWIELILSVSNRDATLPPVDANGDLLDGIPLLNPVLENLAYRYPVHRIKPSMDVREDATHLLVFRDAGLQVRFMEQSPVAARLLFLLKDGKLTGKQSVEKLAEEIGHARPLELIEFARGHLDELRRAGAILGALSQ